MAKILKFDSSVRLGTSSLELANTVNIDVADEDAMLLMARNWDIKFGAFNFTGTRKHLEAERYYFICIRPWDGYQRCLLLFPFWGNAKAYVCITPESNDTTLNYGTNCWIKSFTLTTVS